MTNLNSILSQIKTEAKQKAESKGAYSGYKLVAELNSIQNKNTPVVISLKTPVYDEDYNIIDYTFTLVGSDFQCYSWRGSYDLPAAGYVEDSSFSVQTIIDNILASDGKEVTGWKGGDFTLSMNDIIYIANQGTSNNETAIVGITESDDYIILETEPDMY